MAPEILDRSRTLRRTCREWRRRRVVAGLRADVLIEKNDLLMRRSLRTLQAVDDRRLGALLQSLTEAEFLEICADLPGTD